MKNLIVLAIAAFFATNAVAAEMKWSGSAGWRYSQSSQNDSLDSKDNAANNKDVSTTKTRAHEMRANLGVTGGWEHVEYGLGFRTGNGTTDDYITANNVTDRAIALEKAWFRYARDFGSLDFALTVGRSASVFHYDNAWETLWDNDLRLDGFGWNFKFGMFGLNAAQYVIGAINRGAAQQSTYSYTESSNTGALTNGKFQVLYGFQPYATWKFSDEIEALFAVGYFKWQLEGMTNATGGGVNAAGANRNGAGTVPAVANGNYKWDNKTQWEFLLKSTLPFNLNFTADYVLANKATYDNGSIAGYAVAVKPEVSRSAWTLGLTYGQLKKAQDFTVGYAYTTKGIASMLGAATNDKFGVDNKGHTLVAGYSVADNFNIGFKWMSLSEKERIDTATGVAYAAPAANQKMKTNYWQLTTGVMF